MPISALDNKYYAPYQIWPEEDHAKMGLVMAILSVIFMKGNVLAEEDLFDLNLAQRLCQSRHQPRSTLQWHRNGPCTANGTYTHYALFKVGTF